MAEETRRRAAAIGQGRLGLVDPGRPRAVSPRAQTYLSPPASRAMLKFATVAVVVRNEKRAMKWWKEKLGFRVVTSFPHWITVAPRGANVHLHLCPDSRPEKGNTGFMFSTADAVKEEARLRKKGVKITHPVKKEDWGTIFWFADPDGNEFQVLEY
ncbi:MAG: hypothetical protein E6K15_01180 [Methanobacteriota archaeon]|nr:MAG: hypothetical protein E6K15_01180 [Euryarchaeota archaeon]